MKKENEELNKKTAEFTEDELGHVAGGAVGPEDNGDYAVLENLTDNVGDDE